MSGGARGRMTMRAEIERNQASATDAWGNPVVPAFAALATLACWLWSRQRRVLADGDKTVIVEDLRALFPSGADVAAGDEIARVKDRAGREIFNGRFRIETIQRKPGHLEAALVRLT